MSLLGAKARRAAASIPFLLISVWCFRMMDIEKLVENQQPFVDSGVIEWEGGKVLILDHFHNIGILDQIWRGSMGTFSPSTFGYDPVAWWQMLSFLTDLGPVYALWILESCRAGSFYTPAYLPTLFSLTGQLTGLGSLAPIFYFLCFAFGPTASDLARMPARDRTIRREHVGLLLPLVLVFHTYQVFGIFFSPELSTRHFWTWAWQLAPFWIGVGNVLLAAMSKPLLPKSSSLTSAKFLLLVLGLISAGVWGYMLLYSPYPLSTVFLPMLESQTEFVAHCRKALQADHLAVFGSSFLWLIYSFYDLHLAGLLGKGWLYNTALLLAITAFIGPGAAFTFGWYLREKALSTYQKG
ncbi:uncharacterized protein F4807DRAFT_383483 [Annulohypoxylon truncatum]|uniref:uncharacterized protein n=1 Tax=Annulohypoxylon truncatum TaxID=327061 RepID=UPI002007A89A|nr:uncharacterized protein F4807DRAFT_383483 [Annulohypoxylon truncatum]KAI1211969.1 hypothetical protein F4807DRAFT_383483 [Annulohypoxylon truncatum]